MNNNHIDIKQTIDKFTDSFKQIRNPLNIDEQTHISKQKKISQLINENNLDILNKVNNNIE